MIRAAVLSLLVFSLIAGDAQATQEFRVYVDPDGVLRTDHVLRLWSATVVRLHYKLTHASG